MRLWRPGENWSFPDRTLELIAGEQPREGRRLYELRDSTGGRGMVLKYENGWAFAGIALPTITEGGRDFVVKMRIRIDATGPNVVGSGGLEEHALVAWLHEIMRAAGGIEGLRVITSGSTGGSAEAFPIALDALRILAVLAAGLGPGESRTLEADGDLPALHVAVLDQDTIQLEADDTNAHIVREDEGGLWYLGRFTGTDFDDWLQNWAPNYQLNRLRPLVQRATVILELENAGYDVDKKDDEFHVGKDGELVFRLNEKGQVELARGIGLMAMFEVHGIVERLAEKANNRLLGTPAETPELLTMMGLECIETGWTDEDLDLEAHKLFDTLMMAGVGQAKAAGQVFHYRRMRELVTIFVQDALDPPYSGCVRGKLTDAYVVIERDGNVVATRPVIAQEGPSRWRFTYGATTEDKTTIQEVSRRFMDVAIDTLFLGDTPKAREAKAYTTIRQPSPSWRRTRPGEGRPLCRRDGRPPAPVGVRAAVAVVSQERPRARRVE